MRTSERWGTMTETPAQATGTKKVFEVGISFSFTGRSSFQAGTKTGTA